LRVEPHVREPDRLGDRGGVGPGRAGIGTDRLHGRLLRDGPVDRPALAGQQVAELVQHRSEVGDALVTGPAIAGQVEAESERLRRAWFAHGFTLTVKMEL
jgi:hypothetical protein